MEFSRPDAIAILARTPAALSALLTGLPESWLRANEGKDTWSAFDIVGHLVVVDRTQGFKRVRILLENAEARPFDPVDRFAQLQLNEGKPIVQLLEDFGHVRAENLAALGALKLEREDFNRTGRHPVLGSVTLSEALATWAVHDLNHLHQLSRVMAHQYRDAVGPWKKYLGVLQCSGQSAP